MAVPLWCKSNFSFLEGASHPEELVEQAQTLGLDALALTDRDGVHGMVRAFVKARDLGVKLIAGAQVTVAAPGATLAPSPVGAPRRVGLHAEPLDEHDADAMAPMAGARRGRARRAKSSIKRMNVHSPNLPLDGGPVKIAAPSTSQLVLLAQDRAGWANLCRLLTAGRRRCEKGESVVGWDEVCRHAGGLIALSDLSTDLAVDVPDLKDAFGDRLYARVARHREAEEPAIEARVRARAKALGIPVVAAIEVLYHSRSRRPLQDVLTCIRHGVTLATAGRRIRPNDCHALEAPRAFERLFHDDAAAVARSREIAARCDFSLAQLRYRYPTERLPDGTTTSEHLRALAWAGARKRWPGIVPPDVAAQLSTELDLIDELDYGGYFLTMHEIVEFCRRRDILCQGRGSAANSAVCYALGITAIDPVRMGLLFERFLSRERAEPPDIDLDIEHERREEVIQHVYGKYGRDHSAMVCNIIRYRPRSAVRDVGKVLGIPETALDRAAKMLEHYGDVEDAAIARAGLAEHGTAHVHLARLASEILEFPRHLSIHPGGFLLGHEPVHDIVPIENATMPGRTVIQWDKDDLEDLGLFKVDLLGLGALHMLHRCFDLLRANRGVALSMATIPAEDEETYDMICTADTIGTFQIESRAQMSMLPRLKPREFYDLVIQVAIVRPGPITGGMVHPFLRRRSGLEEVEYPHPSLKAVLEKTLGVPLFQEQVMKLAVVAADYTPGEADQLRRDMAAWRRSGRIEKHRDRLVTRMCEKGIAREFAERVFEQIRGFGEYGFPEAHAASFALIAYATAWMRKHYLPEFVCGLLNAMPMGFYSPATIITDAQRHGLEVRPVDVAASEWDCTLEPGEKEFAVRMGLRFVRGLALGDGGRIVEARAYQPFRDLEDFVRRVHLDARTQATLAEAGALGGLVPRRRDALWQVQGWVRRQDDALALGGDAGADVRFGDLGALDTIVWDYRASDHSVRGHPLAPMRGALRAKGLPDARSVVKMRDGARVDYAGIVICRQRPGTASGVVFMTMEDETGFVNVVVWAPVFEEYGQIIRTTSLLGITGKLQVQEGVVHLIAERAWVPELPRVGAEPRSHDFH